MINFKTMFLMVLAFYMPSLLFGQTVRETVEKRKLESFIEHGSGAFSVQAPVEFKSSGFGTVTGLYLIESDSSDQVANLHEVADGEGGLQLRKPDTTNGVYLRGNGDSHISGGNLGLQQAPLAHLSVKTEQIGSYDQGLFLNQGNTADGFGFWYDGTVNTTGYIESRYPNDAAKIIVRMKGSGTPADVMEILGNGNVGINTTPSYRLHSSGTLFLNGGTDGSFGLGIAAGYSNIKTGTTALNIDNNAGSTNLVSILNNGNTGFGVAPGSVRLSVKPSASNTVGILVEGSVAGSLADVVKITDTESGTTRLLHIIADSNGDAGGPWPSAFTANGRFGIGTIAPSYDFQISKGTTDITWGYGSFRGQSYPASGKTRLASNRDPATYPDLALHSGYIGIGTDPNLADLVKLKPATDVPQLFLNQYNVPDDGWKIHAESSAGNLQFKRRTGASDTNRFELVANGQINVDATSWGTGGTAIGISSSQITTSPSSRRYKKNIIELSVDSSMIYLLEPVEFDYKTDDRHSFGYLAEDTYEILPSITHMEDHGDGLVPESVAYDHLSILIIEELKKLKDENEIMKSWICSQSNAPVQLCN